MWCFCAKYFFIKLYCHQCSLSIYCLCCFRSWLFFNKSFFEKNYWNIKELLKHILQILMLVMILYYCRYVTSSCSISSKSIEKTWHLRLFSRLYIGQDGTQGFSVFHFILTIKLGGKICYVCGYPVFFVAELIWIWLSKFLFWHS